MLQFNATLCNVAIKTIPRTTWRFARLLSSATTNAERQAVEMKTSKSAETHVKSGVLRPKLEMSMLAGAKSLNDLLCLVDNYKLTREDCQNLMSAVTKFINENNIDVKELETDSRFSTLRHLISSKKFALKYPELANKYGSLSTSEMIKTLNWIVSTQYRDLPTVKYLMGEISEYNAQLTPLECLQLLNAMNALDFQHKMLIQKICKQITNTTSISVDIILSLAVAFAKLRYRDSQVLDIICTKVLYQTKPIQPYRVSVLLQSLAQLSFKPAKVELLIKQIVFPLTEDMFSDKVKWLNLVWSLVQFNMADDDHYKSILSNKFIKQVNNTGGWTFTNKLKFLQIQASAKTHFQDSWVPTNLNIPSEIVNTVPLVSRYKQILLKCLDETLKDILPPDVDHRINIMTDMGFAIDAECYLSRNGMYVNSSSEDKRSVALLLCTLADHCRGEPVPVGTVGLMQRLLQERGYDVVILSEKSFGVSDILLKRAKYVHLEIQKIAQQVLGKELEQQMLEKHVVH